MLADTVDVVERLPDQHLELTVDELLQRARPLPPHEEMLIDDVDEEEGRAFLAALEDA